MLSTLLVYSHLTKCELPFALPNHRFCRNGGKYYRRSRCLAFCGAGNRCENKQCKRFAHSRTQLAYQWLQTQNCRRQSFKRCLFCQSGNAGTHKGRERRYCCQQSVGIDNCYSRIGGRDISVGSGNTILRQNIFERASHHCF